MNDRVFYSAGHWRVVGTIRDGYVLIQTHSDSHFRITHIRPVGKGYVTPCWWLFRRGIRSVMNRAIDRVNRLHRKDQRILFGQRTVIDALDDIKLEADALKLLDEEFAS